ncbi:L17 family ribosomal protein [endosymbiont GvMRE of Glomus versiforme]|uniref:L17 family ribosomal protein n=1 Tax=endosymbiont GvMRE of Glomus versiforme TaxID=2039283 RepID=UPI000ECAE3FD|nr:L17 family ribosomal protein [endosymbiont GvMRE of Glomus versiforme]RHZ36638.1 50S ribosomal protein L17 [endosymbiont GvMRE of Glomus versiforme]
MSFILKPGKNSAWRKHVSSNLVADAICYKKGIKTSLPTAKRLKKLLNKLVTYAKKAEKEKEKKEVRQHFYRLALRYLVNKKNVKFKQGKEKIEVLDELFNKLGKKYQNQSGDCSRIIKLGRRRGDGSLRVIFSLVENEKSKK